MKYMYMYRVPVHISEVRIFALVCFISLWGFGLQEKAMEGPCEEATRENLAFIAEQVSHHPPSK